MSEQQVIDKLANDLRGCDFHNIGAGELAERLFAIGYRLIPALKVLGVGDEEIRKKACELCAVNNGSGCTTPTPDPEHWICKAWLKRASDYCQEQLRG